LIVESASDGITILPRTRDDWETNFVHVIYELCEKFEKASHSLAHMISRPTLAGTKNIPQDCAFDWSSYISKANDILRGKDDMVESSKDQREICLAEGGITISQNIRIIKLQNLLFALSEFFTCWDYLLHTIDPQADGNSECAKSGVLDGNDGLRLSFV
jgi:hypothetical protein